MPLLVVPVTTKIYTCTQNQGRRRSPEGEKVSSYLGEKFRRSVGKEPFEQSLSVGRNTINDGSGKFSAHLESGMLSNESSTVN